MTVPQFLSTLLDQMALINETVNDILTNLEMVVEHNSASNVSPCDCCKSLGETLLANNNQHLCRGCYEEYKDMFN